MLNKAALGTTIHEISLIQHESHAQHFLTTECETPHVNTRARHSLLPVQFMCTFGSQSDRLQSELLGWTTRVDVEEQGRLDLLACTNVSK